MDLNAIDPRASSPSANGRNAQSSNGGVFQGVMQMMAEIADRRTETKSRDDVGTETDRRAEEPTSRETRTDDRRETDETDKTETTATEGRRAEDTAATPETIAPTPTLLSANSGSAETPAATTPEAAVEMGGNTVGDQAGDTVPVHAAAEPQSGGAAEPATEIAAADPVQAPLEDPATPQAAAERPATAAGAEPTKPAQPAPASAVQTPPATAQAVERPASDPAAALARAAAATPQRSDQPEPTGKATGASQAAGAKPETGSTRSDLPMGAKVTVETPTPVARSQGVSSAVLVQAQQAAAAGQPQLQASTANGGAGTLHVGGNQPTFVGADGNAAAGQNGSAQNGSGQPGGNNAGAQNQGQNAGQGGQSTPQQIGASFGATIGQRGFGGEASRAQFQQILATRTARPQPAALASGEGGRPIGPAGGPHSSTPLTMAGVGGPQSTHTSASPVDRAAATAHGRPGATLGTPADQVAVKLSATAQDGGGKVTVRLNPEELGKVDIKMEISKDGHVRAVVSVDRPETLELLQKDAKGLERALQDAGLQTDGESLEFDLRGDGGSFAGETGDDDAKGTGGTSDIDEGESIADDQQGDPGPGGVKADGSLDMVA